MTDETKKPDPPRRPRYKTDIEELERICTVEFVRAGGPGGQHRNRRETGIRLWHPPTGIVIVATERRSRVQNLTNAFGRLAERLEALNRVPKRRRPSKLPAAKKRARLDNKKHHGRKKALRRPPRHE